MSVRGGLVSKKTIQDDIKVYKSLSERNRESFDYIELEYGQYAEDFAIRSGYKVNVKTKKMEFTYPESNQEPEQPNRKPLSEEVDELKRDHATLVIQLAEKGVI